VLNAHIHVCMYVAWRWLEMLRLQHICILKPLASDSIHFIWPSIFEMFPASLLCKILHLHTAPYPKLIAISYHSSDKSVTCLSTQKPWFNPRAVYMISMSITVPHLSSETGTIIGPFEATVPRDAVSFCSYNEGKETKLTATNTGVQLTQQLVLLSLLV